MSSSSEIEWIDPVKDRRWDELLRSRPSATVFHSSAWARVLARAYGHRPLYFRLKAGDGSQALVPLMELRSPFTGRRGVCLPFSDFCDPLVESGSGAEGELVEALTKMARDRAWKYMEVRARLGTQSRIAESSPSTFFAHELDLRDGIESVRAGFTDSVHRALRKGERSGLTVRHSTSWESMLAFTRLHSLTRRRHGVPPQPLNFFRGIHRELMQTAQGFVILVERGGRPIAAAVFLNFGTRAVYKFGASDPAELACRPNNLAMAKGIEALTEGGAESLHFGRTDRHQDGLRRFKRSWGAEETGLSYTKFEPKSGRWSPIEESSGGASRAIFRHLPTILNRWAGRLLYPHLD